MPHERQRTKADRPRHARHARAGRADRGMLHERPRRPGRQPAGPSLGSGGNLVRGRFPVAVRPGRRRLRPLPPGTRRERAGPLHSTRTLRADVRHAVRYCRQPACALLVRALHQQDRGDQAGRGKPGAGPMAARPRPLRLVHAQPRHRHARPGSARSAQPRAASRGSPAISAAIRPSSVRPTAPVVISCRRACATTGRGRERRGQGCDRPPRSRRLWRDRRHRCRRDTGTRVSQPAAGGHGRRGPHRPDVDGFDPGHFGIRIEPTGRQQARRHLHRPALRGHPRAAGPGDLPGGQPAGLPHGRCDARVANVQPGDVRRPRRRTSSSRTSSRWAMPAGCSACPDPTSGRPPLWRSNVGSWPTG